jgi:anti-sigma B factor antagonist
MQTDVQDCDGVKVVRLQGDLTGEAQDALADTFGELLTTPHARIIIDLAGVEFMNSAGLSELVRTVAQANVQEARVLLTNPSPYIAGVLETTKLDTFFEVYSTREEALKALC